MSNTVLDYLMNFISGLLLPSFLFILASWRVARLRNLTTENYQDRVNQSVAETIKEQLSYKVLDPLFTNNNIVLPPGQGPYDVIDTLVPGNEVELLASIYMDLLNLGSDSIYYVQILEIINTLSFLFTALMAHIF